jgi:hypothetical protein
VSALTVEGVAVSATTRTTIGDSAVGVRRRAKSGVMRSHKLGDVRTGQIHTDFMSGDEATILRAILASPGPVLHGGTLLGADAYFHVSGVQQQPLGADLWVLSWRIEETGFTPSPLLFSFDADAPGAAYTFTRSGIVGPYTDENGLLQNEATPNVFRTDWQYGGRPALLLEPATTNELLRSEQLDNAAWTKSACSVLAGQSFGPDGLSGLDRIIEDGTSAQHFVSQSVTGMTADAVHALSGFSTPGTRTWVRLVMQNGANNVEAWFDVATGVVGTTQDGGTGTFVRAYVEDWGGGLYRCVLVGSVGNGATTVTASARLATGDGVGTYAGDGTSALQAGYLQLEDNKQFATSYVATVTATATRAVEKMTAPPGFTVADIRAAGGATFYQEWVERGTAWVAGSSTRYWQVGDDVRLLLFSGTAGDGTIDGSLTQDGGGSAQSSPSAVVPIGSPAEARLVLYLDDDDDWKVQCGVSVDGAAEVLGSVATFGATLPEFDEDLMTFAANHDANVHAPVGLRAIKGVPGNRSLAEMGAW